MDANKAQKLRDIHYSIGATCGTCVHSVFNVDKSFGECSKHEYEHKKHSDSKRYLSVLRYGSCPDFIRSPAFVGSIHGFKEFLK